MQNFSLKLKHVHFTWILICFISLYWFYVQQCHMWNSTPILSLPSWRECDFLLWPRRGASFCNFCFLCGTKVSVSEREAMPQSIEENWLWSRDADKQVKFIAKPTPLLHCPILISTLSKPTQKCIARQNIKQQPPMPSNTSREVNDAKVWVCTDICWPLILCILFVGQSSIFRICIDISS